MPGGGKITIPEWMEFLKEDLEVDLKEIEEACIHSITGTLLITFVEERRFLEVLEKVERGVVWRKRGVTIFGWSAGEEISTVQLRNVLVRADLDAVLAELGKYGPVLSKIVHCYKEAPSVKNGWVTLRMRLSSNVELPIYIYDKSIGNTIQVLCDKQQKVCYRCLGKGHIAAFCRKTKKTQTTAVGSSTWASVAAGPVRVRLENQPNQVELLANATVVGVTVQNPVQSPTIVPTVGAPPMGSESVASSGEGIPSTVESLLPEDESNTLDNSTACEQMEEGIGSWSTVERKRKNSGEQEDDLPGTAVVKPHKADTRPGKQQCPNPDLKGMLEEKKIRIMEKLATPN